MNNLCETGRTPTIEEYCSFRLQNIPYKDDVKPQVKIVYLFFLLGTSSNIH